MAVERPRQQYPLLLPAGECRAHVADERAIAHRHGGDVVVHRRGSGGGLDPPEVGVRGEEGDVVGDRAGEEAVVLHDHTGHHPPRFVAEP